MPRTWVAVLLQIVGLVTACSGSAPPRESNRYPSSGVPPNAASSSVENVSGTAVTPPNYALYREHSRQALQAYEQKNYPEFLAQSQIAANAAPDSPRALYNLACAHALNKDAARAAKVLIHLAEKNVYFDVARDSDFDLIKTSNEFAAAQSRMAEVQKTIGGSKTAFTLSQKDLLTEGIAHDSKSTDYFVGSVHKRKNRPSHPD
ncbi:MAG: hypothetical protein IPK82_31745 [Polyangiaceae bacterium]|nr:hypothetical protein [Polyangiaceae bacterium]